jgi:hypothetical protein
VSGAEEEEQQQQQQAGAGRPGRAAAAAQQQQQQQQQRYFDPYEPLDMHDKGAMAPKPIKVVKPKGRRGKRTAVAMAAAPGGRLARAVDQLNNRCGACGWGAGLAAPLRRSQRQLPGAQQA